MTKPSIYHTILAADGALASLVRKIDDAGRLDDAGLSIKQQTVAAVDVDSAMEQVGGKFANNQERDVFDVWKKKRIGQIRNADGESLRRWADETLQTLSAELDMSVDDFVARMGDPLMDMVGKRIQRGIGQFLKSFF